MAAHRSLSPGAAGGTPVRAYRSLQFDVVASLFVVMLAGLAIVAAVLGGLAARAVQAAAADRLLMGARHLERMLADGSGRLVDVAAIARATHPRLGGGQWIVLDAAGRELALGGLPARPRADLAALAARAASGESALEGGLPWRDLVIATPIRSATGERGTLVGRVPIGVLHEALWPWLRSGSFVLVTAALVFVGFGGYLLRGRIVVPLGKLSASTRALAGGDLDARVAGIAGSDEIAELAARWNDMADSLREQRQALIRARENLSRSERLATVGRLAAGVAHEVGNPVAAILGYAEATLRDPDLPEQGSRAREMAELVRVEALRVRGLIRDLLDLARGPELAFAAADPRGLVLRLRERLSRQPLLEGIELRCRVEPDLPLVEVDVPRFEQILTNLIQNAAQALAGKAEPRIELRVELAEERLRARRRGDEVDPAAAPDAVAFRVIDSAGPMPDETLEKAFDPFFTTKPDGTGLGLWNAHRFAELLGGRLEADSAPGRTRFSLLLPRADTQAECRPDAR